MPLSIKVNLRVTGHCNQGGRKYMEDMFSVAYQQTSDDKDLEYAFFGIFDGHGGSEAATFAKEHLMDIIVKQRNFWSDKDEDVLRAIKDGYINTHYAMWRELDKWPTTASGLPSTAGTTASIAFIRKGKIYIGHVGDSGIILGYQEEGDPEWKAKALTRDHKPESAPEMVRIEESGGKVITKSGVPRVVWNRPRAGHKGPVRRSTQIDEIPFLAVARSLGDLWSYNSELDTFVVSPEPDVRVVTVDLKSQRCLIFGTDGLWNMLTPEAAVAIVQSAERHNEKHLIASQQTGNGQADVHMWINPSKSLVDTALEKWFTTRLRADNTSVVTLMLDPPGPSRSEVLMSRKNECVSSSKNSVPSVPRPITPVAETREIVEPSETAVPSMVPRDDAIREKEKLDQTKVSHELLPSEDPTEKIASTEIVDSSLKDSTKFKVEENEPKPETIAESASAESIQVAEISSSDAVEENLTSTSDESNGEIAQTTDAIENPISNENTENPTAVSTSELTRDVTDDVNATTKIPTESAMPSTKEKPATPGVAVLMRQNAFCGSCEEFQSRPRLRRATAGPFASVNRPGNRERVHEQKDATTSIVGIANAPSRRQSGSLVSHLESRSARRLRQSVNGGTTGFLGERQKAYFTGVGSRLKRDALSISRERTIDGIVDKTRATGNSTRQNNKPEATTGTTIVGSKRRHSSTSERAEESKCAVAEPSTKRRTRSEDRPGPIDENDPANQEKSPQQKPQQQQHSRLRWPEETVKSRSSGTSGTSGVAGTSLGNQDKLPSPNSFQRRSLEKKATPVKTIRRPSINGSSRPQLRGSFALREWDQSKTGHRGGCTARSRLNRTVPGVIGTSMDPSSVSSLQRWLRSDTLAATPVKTLRSRNVDIDGHTVPAQLAHQYGIVKQNRLSLPAKIKITGKVGKSSSSTPSASVVAAGTSAASSSVSSGLQNGKLSKQNVAMSNGAVTTTNNNAGGTSASSAITKRVKSPYNPGARSALGTRSRLKRLGK